MEHVQHVEVATNQNVIVHDLALLGKENECYVLLINEILVIVKKSKEYVNLTHLLVIVTKPPLVQ